MLKYLILSLFVAFSGCLHISQKPESLSLSKANEHEEAQWQLALHQEDPDIYILRSPAESHPLYVTAIKKCDIRKGASTTALARELLVGMRDIVVKRQVHLERHERPLLFSLVEARLDDLPINLATFSQKEDDCITDLVIWSESTSTNSLWPTFETGETTKLAAIRESLKIIP